MRSAAGSKRTDAQTGGLTRFEGDKSGTERNEMGKTQLDTPRGKCKGLILHDHAGRTVFCIRDAKSRPVRRR